MLTARKMSSDSFFFADRKELVMETIKAIAQRRTLHGLASIYHGKEADVYKLVYPRRKTAVKITTCTRQDGNALWAGLSHRNVLRLVEAYQLTVMATPIRVYVTPFKERSLAQEIAAPQFGLRHGDYPRVKEWLRHVLCALEYLHDKGLCHLNVTVDNVVLTSKSRAQLCDFDSLKEVGGDPIERSAVGFPWSFLPPEAEVCGCATDLWSFGLTVIDCVTKLTVANADIRQGSWEGDVLPLLRPMLQKEEFCRLVRKAYPSSDIQDKELIRALDLVHGFLQTDPAKRTPAARAKKHPYFGGGKRHRKGEPDPIWSRVAEVVPGDFCAKEADAPEPDECRPFEAVPDDVSATLPPPVEPSEVPPPCGECPFSEYQMVQLTLFVDQLVQKAKRIVEARIPREPERSEGQDETKTGAEPVPVATEARIPSTPQEPEQSEGQEDDAQGPVASGSSTPSEEGSCLEADQEARAAPVDPEECFSLPSLSLSSKADSVVQPATVAVKPAASKGEENLRFKGRLRRVVSRVTNFVRRTFSRSKRNSH